MFRQKVQRRKKATIPKYRSSISATICPTLSRKCPNARPGTIRVGTSPSRFCLVEAWQNERVRSKAKPDKRDAILNAMLDLVVERGFHNAPMSVLAKKAKVSAGIIYHYFPGKEDLITAVYQRVRSMKRAALLEGYTAEMAPAEAFLHVWMNAYRYHRDHRTETRFLDQYESSPFACIPSPERDSDPIQREIQKRFRSRKRGGILNDLPPEVVQELTFGLATRLAKKPKTLSRSALKAVAEKVWRAISED